MKYFKGISRSALKINFRLMLCFMAMSLMAKSQSVFNIVQYGAVGDGATLNTAFIQKAIDECNKSGGGKVFFPEGKWLSGTIVLKTGVVLQLSEKAILLGSPDIVNYQVVDGYKDSRGQQVGYCLIGAVDASNVGIEGGGAIDGQGKLVYASGGDSKRPLLLRFVRCNQVSVQNIQMKAPVSWTFHLFRCKNVNVKGIVIRSRGLINNDGIDIDGCENVVISNCDIDSGDDAICLKTSSTYTCKNISVTGIKISTDDGAIKIGTESAGDFENVNINAIHIVQARLGGIKLLSVDGSRMKDVTISDIVMDKANTPVFIRLGSRMKVYRDIYSRQEPGSIGNIKIKNVKVLSGSGTGILISGIPDHSIDGLTLENIDMHLSGGNISTDIEMVPKEQESAYPEIDMFGKVLPSYGLYGRHIKNLIVKDVVFSLEQPDIRSAVVVRDIEDSQLSTWNLPVNVSSANPLIKFQSTKNISVSNFVLSASPTLFLYVEGADSKGIALTGINSVTKDRMVNLGEGVSNGIVTVK